jgi:hypothetical protein
VVWIAAGDDDGRWFRGADMGRAATRKKKKVLSNCTADLPASMSAFRFQSHCW